MQDKAIVEWSPRYNQQVATIIPFQKDSFAPKQLYNECSRGQAISVYINAHYDTMFDDLNTKTAATYKSCGQYFLEYMNEHGFTTDIVRNFSQHLKTLTKTKEVLVKGEITEIQVPISANTKGTITNAVKKILTKVRLKRSDLIDRNILGNLFDESNLPQTQKRGNREGFNPQEIELIKNYLVGLPDGPDKIRLICQYYLLERQGFRREDIVNIKVEDFNFADKKIVFTRKKENQQPLRLYVKTIEAVQAYLNHFGIKSGRLFDFGTVKHPGHKLFGEWKKIFVQAGCTKGRVMHDFRHHLAFWVLDNGGNARDVANAIGHLSIATIDAYLQTWMSKKSHARLDEKFNEQ